MNIKVIERGESRDEAEQEEDKDEEGETLRSEGKLINMVSLIGDLKRCCRTSASGSTTLRMRTLTRGHSVLAHRLSQ
jgi:hypothetical protein